ncbi:MAG: hypothetical protein OEY14_08165, partial [Myxococcales bacterium]|nr:hypothetical protein [Myxococcales bacterium]
MLDETIPEASDAFVLVLERGDQRATLRFDFDPQRSLRALAHGRSYALSHLEEELGAAVRGSVLALGEALSRGGPELMPFVELLGGLEATLRDFDPAARLTLRRRVPRGQPTPRWAPELRSAEPDSPGPALWPMDAELEGIRLGLRRLIKREWLSREGAERDAAWLARHGLRTRWFGDPGRGPGILFAAPEAETLDRAEALEPETRRRDPRWWGA